MVLLAVPGLVELRHTAQDFLDVVRFRAWQAGQAVMWSATGSGHTQAAENKGIGAPAPSAPGGEERTL